MQAGVWLSPASPPACPLTGRAGGTCPHTRRAGAAGGQGVQAGAFAAPVKKLYNNMQRAG